MSIKEETREKMRLYLPDIFDAALNSYLREMEKPDEVEECVADTSTRTSKARAADFSQRHIGGQRALKHLEMLLGLIEKMSPDGSQDDLADLIRAAEKEAEQFNDIEVEDSDDECDDTIPSN